MDDHKKLDEQEITLAGVMVNMFITSFSGNENAVKTKGLICEFAKLGIAIQGRDIRKLLGHIRQNDLLAPQYILSDVSIGYWLSNNEAEMSAFIDKQMNRMTTQFQNIKPLHQRIRYGKKAGPYIQPQLL